MRLILIDRFILDGDYTSSDERTPPEYDLQALMHFAKNPKTQLHELMMAALEADILIRDDRISFNENRTVELSWARHYQPLDKMLERANLLRFSTAARMVETAMRIATTGRPPTAVLA